jgi:hypothetical protein
MPRLGQSQREKWSGRWESNPHGRCFPDTHRHPTPSRVDQVYRQRLWLQIREQYLDFTGTDFPGQQPHRRL